jgi:predicted small metal-binding protein
MDIVKKTVEHTIDEHKYFKLPDSFIKKVKNLKYYR